MGYITINSKFKPFSYDELVKPLIYYKEAYDKAEKDYSDLAAQTETFRDIASQEENPVAYELYKSYSDDLNKAMEDFSKGMTATNRRDLIKLKRGYASKIGAISRAYQQASEENKRRADMMARNPNIRMKNPTVKVDEYLGGKTPINDYIDTSELLKRATLDFGNIAKTIVSDPKFKATANKYLSNVELSQGITPETLQKIMSDPNFRGTTAEQMYKEVFDRYNQIDINDYSERDQQDIMNAIRSAAYTGLNTIKNQFVSSGLEEQQRNALSWANYNLSKKKFEQDSEEAKERLKILKSKSGNRSGNSEGAENLRSTDRTLQLDLEDWTPEYFDPSEDPLDDDYTTVTYDELTEKEKQELRKNGVKDPTSFTYHKYKGGWLTNSKLIAKPLKMSTKNKGNNEESSQERGGGYIE